MLLHGAYGPYEKGFRGLTWGHWQKDYDSLCMVWICRIAKTDGASCEDQPGIETALVLARSCGRDTSGFASVVGAS